VELEVELSVDGKDFKVTIDSNHDIGALARQFCTTHGCLSEIGDIEAALRASLQQVIEDGSSTGNGSSWHDSSWDLGSGGMTGSSYSSSHGSSCDGGGSGEEARLAAAIMGVQQDIGSIQSEVAVKNYSRAPELAGLQQQLGQLHEQQKQLRGGTNSKALV
jgi:hypothetical protein